MTFKGRLIFPILCLTFTVFNISIAIIRGELFNFENGNYILFNIACFTFVLVTFFAFFILPRDVYIDSEKLIIKYPIHPLIHPHEIVLSQIEYFKIQSLIRVPGYLLSLYLHNEHTGKKEIRKNVSFNIKGSDLDKLLEQLRLINIKQRDL